MWRRNYPQMLPLANTALSFYPELFEAIKLINKNYLFLILFKEYIKFVK